MPYLMLGYPTAQTSLDACKVLLAEGVHGLELGLPFRDPVADGPVIQSAGNQALDNGFNIDKALALVKEIRALNDKIPLTLMCYYNMLMARGIESFIQEFSAAGIDGILIPDLPLERVGEIKPALDTHGIKFIYMASPLTTAKRLAQISEIAGGFIYVVTRLGITGTQENYSESLSQLFQKVHENTKLPVVAGFGISQPEHAQKMIFSGADGIIIGSKIVEIINECITENDLGFDRLKLHTKNIISAI